MDAEDRHRRLLEGKLRALVRGRLGAPDAELPGLSATGGTAVRAGDDLWVYAPGDPARALGRALALHLRAGTHALHLVLDTASGHDARVAGLLATPVDVWAVEGTALVPVAPEPLPIPADPPDGALTAGPVRLLAESGVELVVEHGTIVGEVRGLEVARVRITDAGVATLDIGVGRFDQEAAALLHGDLGTAEALAKAAGLVASHRRPGAVPHPVNRLARERWLRAQLLDDPSPVGLAGLVAISPPLPRRNVKDPAPASAIGHDAAGATVLVVCTVGVDLEWVPVAADLVAREGAARVVVAMPARDLLPVQQRLAACLAVPVELRAVEGDWPA